MSLIGTIVDRILAVRAPGVLSLLEGCAFQISPTPTLPTCDVTRRFERRTVKGGAGVADREVMCDKSAADAYAWRELGQAALDDRYVSVTGDTMTGNLIVEANSAQVAIRSTDASNVELKLYDTTDGGYAIFTDNGALRFCQINTSGTFVQNEFALGAAGGVVINEDGNNVDFRVEGDTATQLLVVGAGIDAVAIGNTVAGAIAVFADSAIILNSDVSNRDTVIRGDTDADLFHADASADAIGIGTGSPAGSKLDINDDSIRIRTSKTPASASATGTQGEVAWDSSFVYVCTATDTWKRAAIATW